MLCHRGDVYVWTNGCVVCVKGWMDGLHIYSKGHFVCACTSIYILFYSGRESFLCVKEDFCKSF